MDIKQTFMGAKIMHVFISYLQCICNNFIIQKMYLNIILKKTPL